MSNMIVHPEGCTCPVDHDEMVQLSAARAEAIMEQVVGR